MLFWVQHVQQNSIIIVEEYTVRRSFGYTLKKIPIFKNKELRRSFEQTDFKILHYLTHQTAALFSVQHVKQDHFLNMVGRRSFEYTDIK